MAAGFRSSSRPGQVWAPEIKHDDLGNLVIGPPNPRAVECKEVYLGADHTILVSRDGDVYSCGRGDSGQLGHGALSHHFEPTRIDAVLHDKIVRVATAGARRVATPRPATARRPPPAGMYRVACPIESEWH